MAGFFLFASLACVAAMYMFFHMDSIRKQKEAEDIERHMQEYTEAFEADPSEEKQYVLDEDTEIVEETSSLIEDILVGTISLEEIQQWYKNRIPSACKNLPGYVLEFNKDFSSIHVIDGKFFFGNNYGMGDCHYVIDFTCEYFGDKCAGRARAFARYNDNGIYFFSMEIWKISDNSIVIDHFEEEQIKVIEDYYNYLETRFQ